MYMTVTISHLGQDMIVSVLVTCQYFQCQGCIQKDQVQTAHVHAHNTARSMMDMKRDKYRDQIVSMSV